MQKWKTSSSSECSVCRSHRQELPLHVMPILSVWSSCQKEHCTKRNQPASSSYRTAKDSLLLLFIPLMQAITFFHRTPLPFSFQMRKLGTNFPYQSSGHWFLMGNELMAESTVNKGLLFSSNIYMNSRFCNAIFWNILLSASVKRFTFCYRQAGNACIINVCHISNWTAIILEESSTLLEGNRYILQYMYCKY